MIPLKEAIGGMSRINQFFVWRLVWDAAEGKYHKTPTDGSEYPMNAQDSSNWMSFDAAMQTLAKLSAADPVRKYTLGFYLTRDTGYWFLDVDKAIGADGVWSPVASYLYNAFPDAAFEYSSSNTGYHLFGRGAMPYDHATKNTAAGLELYVHNRGIAFGLSGLAQGNADKWDHSATLANTVMPAYFPPRAELSIDVDQVGPRVDWRGPVDDDELIARARRSSSAASKFNAAKANFADLFDGNRAVLDAAYKDEHGQPAESEMDMALASHLAFWTGCDADRIERLMRRSALARPKWNEHATYLRKLTINNARALCRNVLQDKPIEPVGFEVVEPIAAEGRSIEGSVYLNSEEQIKLFKGCVYVVDDNRVFVPKDEGFNLVGADQFSNMFGNYAFPKDPEGKAMARSAFEAFTRSTLNKYPLADRAGFRPDLESGCLFSHEGYKYVNTYVPYKPRRVVGDASPFLNHVAKMLPDLRDQQILLSYLAACVQHKGVKFKWCPVLQGLPGNGKSLLGDFVCYALGGNFVHKPKPGTIDSNFNDWLYEKLFIQVDEVRVKRGEPEIMDVIKPMITDNSQQIEAKGGKKRMRSVCGNFYMSMNDRANLIKEEGDRRFAIFYTAQQVHGDMERTGMDQEYMRKFVDWYLGDGRAIVAEWLHTWAIPVEFNPATTLLRAPHTSSEAEVTIESRSRIEVEMLEAIEEAKIGFRDGWICWSRLKALFDNRVNHQTLELYLTKLGYLPHPSLGPKGITNNGIAIEDGLKVRLYCKVGHPTIGLKHADVCNKYTEAQANVNSFTAPAPPLALVR